MWVKDLEPLLCTEVEKKFAKFQKKKVFKALIQLIQEDGLWVDPDETL
jgi:hypothetical protein